MTSAAASKTLDSAARGREVVAAEITRADGSRLARVEFKRARWQESAPVAADIVLEAASAPCSSG